MKESVKRIKSVEIKSKGIMDDCVSFVLNNQLKNRELWKNSVEAFSTREDSEKGRWRGEYFGKMMRGATLIYSYTKDEELYGILTDTVLKMLEKQDELGRFSTYKVENEFTCWDTWCRKYVLVGFLYYIDICKDKALTERIYTACKKHLDYVLEKIGAEENQKPILETSHFWGCVNSCTILEPTLELYKRTGEERYMDFAKYIISTGGCSTCNLVELPLTDERFPYQYEVRKAYEMMSFYEGLLAYFELTGEKKYFDTVSKFVDLVKESDITVIGCAGCTHELFDNSSNVQTEYQENIMQETCVTVTWMRLNRRLFELTGNKKYIDNFEISGYNALYGSLNTEMNEQYCMETDGLVKAMAFDSYSPLYMNTRGRGVGGFNDFPDGSYNGCCISIGACGIALMPLTAVMQDEEKVFINGFFNGVARVKDKNGKCVLLKMESEYPANGNAEICVDGESRLSLYIRKPEWCERMTVNEETVQDDYFVIDKKFEKGEKITVCLQTKIKTWVKNGKIAFTYGALTLATDEQKSEIPLSMPIDLNEKIEWETLPVQKGELIRFERKNSKGEGFVLTDYQSCGKKWRSEKPLMTVWFNGK